MHVNAAVAVAAARYLWWTEDERFERDYAVPLLVETARLWMSLGYTGDDEKFHIDGITGPDEYTALRDDNVYTNLMAARNMEIAAKLSVRHMRHASQLGVTEEEVASWRDAAASIVVPYDQHARITQQCNGFTRLRPWDFEATPADDYPLLLHHHNYMLYSSRVIKQADLVFAIYQFGYRWDEEQKVRDFTFYESVNVRDSSLSAAIQAVVAAEVGHLELAFDYLNETAFIDLRDLASNTHDGVHLAALSGVWLAIVAGFGGMRDHGDTLAFAPRMPSRLTRLRFGVLYRGRRLRIEVGRERATYELIDGEPLEVVHHGERITVEPGRPLGCPVPPAPQYPPTHPPHGREPAFAHGEIHPLPQAPHGG